MTHDMIMWIPYGHPRGVTHGMSHVVHLCERLTLSRVSNEEIMGKEKKIKKN